MFAYDLFTHQDTVDMIRETRRECDDDEEVHCWLTGIPYDYWSQYDGIFDVFLQLSGASAAAGFAIAWLFLLGKLCFEGRYGLCKLVCGSLVGALFIAVTIILSLVTVAGLRYVPTHEPCSAFEFNTKLNFYFQIYSRLFAAFLLE